MSFFEDTKNAGTLLLIIGVISLIAAIISLFLVADGTNISFTTDIKLAGIMTCIAGLIEAIVFIILGLDIRNGACRVQIGNLFSDVGSKFGVLTAFLAANGITTMIAGVCSLIGGDVSTGALGLIMGLITLLFAYMMSNGSAGKVIWIILLIVSVIMAIFYLISILAIVTIPSFLLAIMVVIFILSPEVKEKMS